MEYEQTQANIKFKHKLPKGCRWPDLCDLSGLYLLKRYRHILSDLSKSKNQLIAAIYSDAQSRIREPRHLEQLIKQLNLIDWFSAQKDGLGDLYEGLLEKNANETKSGAGQYFTPRPLIDSIIRCIQPQAGETIQDPAAGTAGFLIAADSYIKAHTNDLLDLNEDERIFQIKRAFIGMELVPETRRLALMNCLLHGMEGSLEGVVRLGNTLSLSGAQLPKADVILTNPPFGTAKGGGGPTRNDFTYKTSNKQLAFLQHVYRSLKPGGRAAVVLPDNVLFEAGVGINIRRDLMHKCNLHTILRLPTGIFYAQGVKTNVLFFTKGTTKKPGQKENCTENVWVYDLRSNIPSFGKRTPFEHKYLIAFEECYGMRSDGTSRRNEGEWSFNNEEVEQSTENSRWRVFNRDFIRIQNGDSLDISWIKDENNIDTENIPEPDVLAAHVMVELTEALQELDDLMQVLGSGDKFQSQSELLLKSLRSRISNAD